MKRSNLAAALSLLMTVGTVAPVFADDNSGLDKAVDASLIVDRVAGATAGFVIGTPIAILKESTRSFVHMTSGAADKVGGHDFMPSCLLASFFSVPATIIIGPAKGLTAGTKNSINGFKSPFNTESFSLGNLNEE